MSLDVKAAETVRHQLSLSVRPQDHFSGAAWPSELDLSLDAQELPVRTTGADGARQGDGTYRFVSARPGVRQLRVQPRDDAFTWTATTAVTLPLAPAALTHPLLIDVWPGPRAKVAAGTLAIRGRLITAGAGQEVGVEVVGVPPRARRTRCDASGEFLFLVLGPTVLTTNQQVELAVSVPGRVLTSIQVLDGDTNPVFAGTHFTVFPGRELRAAFHLT